jgi:hypothetical protein
MSRSDEHPLNGQFCQRVESSGSAGGVRQQPLRIRAGEVYRGSFWARGTCDAGLAVSLADRDAVLAEQTFDAPSAAWREYPFELVPPVRPTARRCR